MYITGKKKVDAGIEPESPRESSRMLTTSPMCHLQNERNVTYIFLTDPKTHKPKKKKPLKFTTHCAIGIGTRKYFVLLLYFKYSIFFHNIYQYNSWFYQWFYNIVLSCKYWSTGFQLFRIQGNIFVIWWRTHNICECLNMNVYLITKCWLYARISKV